MLQRVKKRLGFKDKAKIFDRLRVTGGGEKPGYRGIRMSDGSQVPLETIMTQFGVDRERALKIQKRMTR